MLRRVGVVVAVAGVALFLVGFFWLVTTGGSSCAGSGCHRRMWVLLPASVLAFASGVVMASFGGQGYGRSHGPATFADVDSGAYAPRPRQADAAGSSRNAGPRWSRSWRNRYAIVAACQLGFALLFAIAGIIAPESRGTAFLTAALLALIGLPFVVVAYRAGVKDRLHDAGLEATARVLGLQQTGTWINNNPYVRLDLEVTVPGHPAYEVRHAEVVPQILIGRLTDGTPLHLRVDPAHPSHFVIEWERG